jgi:2,3-bisphosphoglycerate-dependent phosphoglycerate mutase
MTYRLVLLRHGQSVWNKENLFTGWYDADLSEQGCSEASRAGRDLAAAGIAPDILHTSLQTRAIRTAQMTLDELDLLWIPVRRSWRLNERHYGDLQGKDKAETARQYGADQVKIWRRAYAIAPPPLDPGDERHPRFDARYADLPPDVLPASECLKDVVERMLPWWYDAIVPDLQTGATVLVAAHGNSLRALIKHLDQISDDDIVELNLPTGMPIVYDLGDDLRPIETMDVLDRVAGDASAARAAADAVSRQAEEPPKQDAPAPG